MGNSHKLILMTMLACGVVACGKSGEEPKPPPVKDTVFGDLVATKEKAKQKTEEAMELNRQKLEDSMKKVDDPNATP